MEHRQRPVQSSCELFVPFSHVMLNDELWLKKYCVSSADPHPLQLPVMAPAPPLKTGKFSWDVGAGCVTTTPHG